MTQIEQNRLNDFLATCTNNSFHVSVYGYVVRVEERLDGGSHLGKSIRIHPGGDNMLDCMRDICAIIKDNGNKIIVGN